MIERILIAVLFLTALLMGIFSIDYFWIPLGLGIVLTILFFRLENKQYSIRDNKRDWRIVDNVKFDAEDD